MMTNISMSLVSMLYNFQLLKLAGENGVAAYGVIMYVNFIFVAAFIGYSVGSAPIISFNYGAVSAIISFLRTLLFQVVAVMVLPIFFELDGIWYSVIMAEMLALIVTVGFLITRRSKYQY